MSVENSPKSSSSIYASLGATTVQDSPALSTSSKLNDLGIVTLSRASTNSSVGNVLVPQNSTELHATYHPGLQNVNVEDDPLEALGETMDSGERSFSFDSDGVSYSDGPSEGLFPGSSFASASINDDHSSDSESTSAPNGDDELH